MTITKMKNATACAIGGSTSHRPAQENARNNPSAVASVASAGHSRSHKQTAARAFERPRQQHPFRVLVLLWLLVQSVQKPLRRPG